MILLKDLGITDLNGTLKRPRHYYTVQCPNCEAISTMRLDQAKSKTMCQTCNREAHQNKLKQQALDILEKGEKQCSVCKKVKPLEAFGHKSQLLSGFRPACKECRYEAEKETNKKYLQSVRGKLSSAIRQSKRRDLIKKADDSTITIDFLEELKIKQDHKCYHCQSVLLYDVPYAVHLDHLIPISKGGGHSCSNVVWSCQQCNLRKSNTLIQ